MDQTSNSYSVILAEDGERALEKIDLCHPDLMIIDVMMPKMNGFQICRRVKSDPESRDTPVILLTARVQEEDVFWGRDCGADEYITKPFRTQDLENSVARLLQRSRSTVARSVASPVASGPGKSVDSQIVMLRWDPVAMDIFRKKHGEIRFSEALRSLRGAVEKYLSEHRQKGPVEVHVPFGLSVILLGDRSEALRAGQEIVEMLDVLAKSFYEKHDQSRGHIRYRNPRSGCTEHLPLLSFSAQIEPDKVV